RNAENVRRIWLLCLFDVATSFRYSTITSTAALWRATPPEFFNPDAYGIHGYSSKCIRIQPVFVLDIDMHSIMSTT
ncbi:hypothetical protein O0536_25685, partial [Brevibacillus laterosporus]|uniref:hypothetical protein n=1 Tax=Brevibacillus laterosporus TaxID=1465 RepID=UPI0022A7E19D